MGTHGRNSILVALSILGAGLSSLGCGGGGSGRGTSPSEQLADSAAVGTHQFTDASTCQRCHPVQHREWQGSVMHYGAESPVFNAFELTIQKLSQGAVAANGVNANFCVECHAPSAPEHGAVGDFLDAASATPVRDSFDPVSRDGVSCDVCHTATGPDLRKSFLADGIGNLSLELQPGDEKQGPIADPVANAQHTAVENPYLTSAEFCGGCHDVRLPAPDVVTGEPFQRLENLFTEWQEGPYNTVDNPFGKVITCQDCHMSTYPQTDPGVYPEIRIANDPDGPPSPLRRHALHAFTAVSLPFVDDARFPNRDTVEQDDFGYPLGQQQRREQMLQAACELDLEETPGRITPDAQVIPVVVTVTNTGAGHNVPAGFSQERQVWVELVVEDDAGVIYESGVLHDQAHPETGEAQPDGRLDDEDLEDLHFVVDLETFDTHVEEGPDVDQRPRGVNLGLVNFQNRFIRVHDDGSWEPVLNPILANHMDNSHSLPMLQPRAFAYDIPVPARGLQGDVRVTARLRYRAFPPEFLRFLAQREPDLVDEAIVDRNTIVDMTQDTTRIRVGFRRR